MKNFPLTFAAPVFLAAFLLVTQNIFCAGNPSANFSAAENNQSSISAPDYCAFLNSEATSDPNHLYHWKMADGSWKILRSGAPGNYCYQAGGWRLETVGAEKNTPMLFLSYNDAAQYCAWKNKNDAHSSSLQSSNSGLSIDEELHVSDVSFTTAAAEQTSEAEAVAGFLSGDELEMAIGFELFFIGTAGEFAGAERIESHTHEDIRENERVENGRFIFDSDPRSSNAMNDELSIAHTIDSNNSLETFRAVANDSNINENQPLSVVQAEDGSKKIGVLFDGNAMSVLSEKETKANHNTAVNALVKAITNTKVNGRPLPYTIPYFPDGLKQQAKQTGLTRGMIQEVIANIDNDLDPSWKNVPGTPSENVTREACRLTLMHFALSLNHYVTSLPQTLDPTLTKALTEHIAAFRSAFKNNNPTSYDSALHCQKQIENMQSLIDACIKRDAAPVGTVLRAAWNNVVLIKNKLVLLKEELMNARAAKKTKRTELFEKLVKEYESYEQTRTQAARELQLSFAETGTRLAHDHELIANDNAEIFEKIAWCQSQAASTTSKQVQQCWQSMIETYGKIVRYRHKVAADFKPEQQTPEVKTILESIEKNYAQALDARGMAIVGLQGNHASYSYSKAADVLEEAARSHDEALNAFQKNDLLEQRQHEKFAKEYEVLFKIQKLLIEHSNPGLMVTAQPTLDFCKNFIREEELINEVLSSPDADGNCHWKDRQKFDFPKRLGAAFNTYPEVMMDQINEKDGEKKMADRLRHSLQIIEKNNELLSLVNNGLVITPVNTLSNMRVENFLLEAIRSYAASTRHGHAEQRGDAYVNAIKALLAYDNKSDRLAGAWEFIAKQRKNLDVDYLMLHELHLNHRYTFVQHQCEYLISLYMQAIKGIEEGIAESEIENFVQEAERLALLANKELADIKEIIDEKIRQREATASAGGYA